MTPFNSMAMELIPIRSVSFVNLVVSRGTKLQNIISNDMWNRKRNRIPDEVFNSEMTLCNKLRVFHGFLQEF